MQRDHKIIVYTPTITNRIRYVIDQVFEDWMNLEVAYVSDEAAYLGSPFIKINYSKTRIAPDELWIPSSGFLVEHKIRGEVPEVHLCNRLPCLFFLNEQRADFPFDLLAMIFFFLSRYEEYFSHKKDDHGRYAVENSLAYKHGFLQQALVDHWLMRLKDVLCRENEGLSLDTGNYTFIPTYDIDYAWAFLHKGVVRTIGRLGKSLTEGNFSILGKHLKTILGFSKDPFDQFEWMDQLHERYGVDPIYFIQVGDWGEYDKNTHWKNPAQCRLIRDIYQKYKIGLHPSYHTSEQGKLLKTEKARLEEIIGAAVHYSRQHYIRLSLPTTYRKLLRLGITDDFSMGYPNIPGFRASVSRSFLWYDLEHEMAAQLRIHPFCLMDGAFKKYLQQSPEASKATVLELYQEISRVGGTFMSIWHNSSFSEIEGWAGWKAFYEWMVNSVNS